MECKQVWGVYWSATGNTRRVVERLAAGLADGLGQSCRMVDLTPQNARAQPRRFRAGDLVVVGLPTYAGKLPNKILPDVQTKLQGGGALAVGVVTFGNRSFDNALAELCVTLETDGFHTVAAAAFVGRHAFTDRLAAGRPDGDDLRQADAFARCVAERVRAAPRPGGRARGRRRCLLRAQGDGRPAGQVSQGQATDRSGPVLRLRGLCPGLSHGGH